MPESDPPKVDPPVSPAGPLGTPPAPTPEPPDDEFDKERAMATIHKLREFERTAKAQLKELETLKAEKARADDAQLSELEKARKQLADVEARRLQAEAELASLKRVSIVARLAASAGAQDPQDANILAATANIDVAAANAEQQIKEIIEAVKTARPYLFRQQPGSATLEPFNPAGSPGAPQTDQQRVKSLLHAVGVGKFGPLG